jgi:hypothetical protein
LSGYASVSRVEAGRGGSPRRRGVYGRRTRAMRSCRDQPARGMRPSLPAPRWRRVRMGRRGGMSRTGGACASCPTPPAPPHRGRVPDFRCVRQGRAPRTPRGSSSPRRRPRRPRRCRRAAPASSPAPLRRGRCDAPVTRKTERIGRACRKAMYAIRIAQPAREATGRRRHGICQAGYARTHASPDPLPERPLAATRRFRLPLALLLLIGQLGLVGDAFATACVGAGEGAGERAAATMAGAGSELGQHGGGQPAGTHDPLAVTTPPCVTPAASASPSPAASPVLRGGIRPDAGTAGPSPPSSPPLRPPRTSR